MSGMEWDEGGGWAAAPTGLLTADDGVTMLTADDGMTLLTVG